MRSSTARLLQAAAEIVGGEKQLAAHLGIGERLLSKFMSDTLELPDPLLLRAVDIVLAHRDARRSLALKPGAPSPEKPAT